MANGGNPIGRLERILQKIEDPEIKNIIKKVIDVEISHRSTERNYFPWKKIRDIIDDAARIKESEEESNKS